MMKRMNRLIPTFACALAILALAILSFSAQPIPIAAQERGQPDQRAAQQTQLRKQPTEQQVRAHVLGKMQARLTIRSRGFTGWQNVYTTPKGTTIYGYVQGGKVVGFAIGRPNMVPILRRLAPRGTIGGQTGNTSGGAMRNPNTGATTGETPVITGGGVMEQPDTGGGPTEEECALKAVKCMMNTSALDFLRGLAMVKNIFTLDLDALVENYEDKEARTNECIGAKCKEILGID